MFLELQFKFDNPSSWPGETKSHVPHNVIVHGYVRGHGMAHLIDSESFAPDSLTSVLSGATDGPRTEPLPADSSILPPALSATTTVAPLVTKPAADCAPQREGFGWLEINFRLSHSVQKQNKITNRRG